MKISKPCYYDSFRCIAGACPDSCCQEWAVVVDDDKAAFYRSLPGDLGDRLRSVLVEEDGETVMAIEDRRCPMWRADGLCRIQAELGEQALCKTCREFPRLTHDYGDFTELQLELSCPVAAELILHGDDTAAEQEIAGGEAEYDPEVMETLRRSRGEALRFLRDTAVPVGEALAQLLLFAYDVQEELDGGEKAAFVPADLHFSVRGDAAALLRFLGKLEILTDRWRARLDDPQNSTWTEEHRALARYFVQRYWLQAISDYDLVSRAKLVIISCLTIKLLGGDVVSTAQLYSKEIENDADNVDALLDGAYTDVALTDSNLLGLLLHP